MTGQKHPAKKPEFDIRQIVPPSWCFTCDVCCRFPEKTSFLAPYFTCEEITIAKTLLKEGGRFFNPPHPHTGCKITLQRYKEGYICPAFDPASSHCKIYDNRPVDCMLYPFAIMWDPAGEAVLLGVDKKCPYIISRIEDNSLKKASLDVAASIESSPLLDIIGSNKGLIGPFQEDVAPLLKLEKLTGIVNPDIT